MCLIKPTIQNSCHAVCVALKAAVPLVEDDAADASQTQEQSSLQWFLKGESFRPGGGKHISGQTCDQQHLLSAGGSENMDQMKGHEKET